MDFLVGALVRIINTLLQGSSGRIALFILAFLCASAIALFVLQLLSPALRTRARITEQLKDAGISSRRALLAGQEKERIDAVESAAQYYQQLEKSKPDSVHALLYQAGFHGTGALPIFYAVRIGLCAAMFFGLFIIGRIMLPSAPMLLLFIPSFLYSLAFLVLPNVYLRRLANRREESCRRGFPDFMDMMVVCADAGLSLEAAVEKVVSELIFTHKALGIHLKIMSLEIRAGRPLREALSRLADRLKLSEAKTLATLFRQSEELGTSLTQTLRVYSAEMRDRRIVAAEERANALPVKLVLPLGFCVFPVILVMILLPMWVRMVDVFL